MGTPWDLSEIQGVATAGNDDRHGPSHWARLSVFWERDLLLPVCKEAKSPQRTNLTDPVLSPQEAAKDPGW